MRAAWHFWFAVSFGGESGLLKVDLGGTHPLTQRYIFKEWYLNYECSVYKNS
ncbi:DUF3265 domain-containing protein, partial [Vibrio cholerae]|nr:DUF3265 domain-containing protein [Vibrio cholerae]MVD63371.1 DUF3265 domain-containing protein [Vibrio cholerae]MVE15979.1 DUF3265 domain-containing protein [Vibrio cholerae]MVE60560.1 DUF3265 domain-containing protein [Vibrio cholerae]MVF64632.1 DUF3265 domain-containing protein [Vibrio cholerae]